MHRVKWQTFLGTVLAVTSSTLLYINGILQAIKLHVGSVFYTNPMLNVFVFGINGDSVANDVGMFVLSGTGDAFITEVAHFYKRMKSDWAAVPVRENPTIESAPRAILEEFGGHLETPKMMSGSYESCEESLHPGRKSVSEND